MHTFISQDEFTIDMALILGYCKQHFRLRFDLIEVLSAVVESVV